MLESRNYLSLALKLILFLSILNSIYFQLWHILSANIFLLILVFIPDILKSSSKVIFPKEFELTLLIFVILTIIFGRTKGIIAPIAFGFGISFIGFIISTILSSTNKIKQNTLLITIFSFSLAVAFGTAIELIKYYLKMALGHTIDTSIYTFSMMTLTYVLAGALLSSIIGYIYMKTGLTPIKIIVNTLKAKNPDIFEKETTEEELKKLIAKGENEKLEFKSTLRTNLYTNQPDKKIEHSVLKTIVAFLNSKGGELIVGVEDNGNILGIEKDNFESTDKFNLHLMNLIKQKIGKKHLELIKVESLAIQEKQVIRIDCKPSNNPIFLIQEDQEEFYIRTGPASNLVLGRELLDYVKKRFEKK